MPKSQDKLTPFHVNFSRRDFSGPVLPAVSLTPDRLSWSAFGGPHQASFSARDAFQNLLDLASLLRCGVMVRDHQNTPVWWGFVDQVIIFLEEVQVKVSLDALFNQVKVVYSFLSPDNKLADQFETDWAVNLQSQREFGIKATILRRTNLDDHFAASLRDTFLSLHAFPTSELSQRSQSGYVRADIHCSGWFKTLAWQNYQNQEGFYANYGPGPGVFAFGDSPAQRLVAQSFIPGADVALKYAYFRLRAEGSPTTSLTAQVRENDSWRPGAVLSESSPVSGASLPGLKYAWFRFAWQTPFQLSAGVRYWITLDPGDVDPVNYFYIKTDENMNYRQLWQFGRYYNQSTDTWLLIPSITAPDSRPDLIFRLVCVSDTGDQIVDIASSCNQFFEKVLSFSTGVLSSPYRINGVDGLKEIQDLMNLGTSRQRLVLAKVTPERHLIFYEQPDPDQPDIYIDAHSRFFTKQCVPIPSYLPPVGRFARLAATTRFNLPWDRNRLPACFILRADYFPQTGRVVVKSL